MWEKSKDLFSSRKFYAGIIGVVLTYINSQLNILNEVQMVQIIAVISAWIVGQGLAESGSK